MHLNLTAFFAYVRKAPFGGRLTQDQVEGTEIIINKFYSAGGKDLRHLAYILATAFHETGGRMVPVREGFAKTDAAARRITAKYKYGKPEENGKVYYGRGHVQLTWGRNYAVMGKLVGLPLYDEPDLALKPEVSVAILVEGMMRGVSAKGDFTGKAVEDYFNALVDDPVGARAVVNGKDKAVLIAGYHQNFLDALDAAAQELAPSDVTKAAAQPDKPNMHTDEATIGTISAVAGSGLLGVFGAINSPWAFAAFAVLAVGLYLFVTGRIKIVKKGGV